MTWAEADAGTWVLRTKRAPLCVQLDADDLYENHLVSKRSSTPSVWNYAMVVGSYTASMSGWNNTTGLIDHRE